MKSGVLAIILGSLFSMGLEGCLAQKDLMKERTLEGIIVSQPGNFDEYSGRLNEFEPIDLSTLEAFQGVIDRAEKMEGTVELGDPDYEVKIEDKRGRNQTIVLWVGEKGENSALAVKGNSSVIYTVSEEDTVILHQLFVSLFDTTYETSLHRLISPKKEPIQVVCLSSCINCESSSNSLSLNAFKY